jgi:hypothetical protein
MTEIELENEAARATELLAGKIVSRVWRHREAEVGVEFTDGTRLFVDRMPSGWLTGRRT